jgi:L-alanine-DL-glutamate epimerase-like enolase superfamily enzyme
MGFGLKHAGQDGKAEIARRASPRRARSCLDPYLDRRPRELSGGQRQRVAIGRAIVRDPRGVPVRRAALEPRRQAAVQMRTEIARLHQARQATMIYVTHDQVEAMTLADKIVVLRAAGSSRSARRWSSTTRPANRFVAGLHRLALDEPGTGYSYTIGTGGSSVMRLIADHLAPRLIGRDADMIEAIWHELEFATHATTIGAITAIALAAIDTALWDLRARKQGLPLWKLAGGAKEKCPLYTTEGGWLHIEAEALVDDAVEAKAKGFLGSKVKIGRPHGSEDHARLSAVRAAVGDGYEIMTDCNQGFAVDEAIRRADRLRELDLAWFEEPLPADDIDGHVRLSRSTSTPIAVGESLYSIRHFREYMQKGGCSIVQVDVGRIGGITPWLKVAHAAEAFDIPVCPHFLMELHVSLTCAVPNGKYVEYIPQLDELTSSRMRIENGHAHAPSEPGIGIDWDWDAVRGKSIDEFTTVITQSGD